MKKPKSIFSLLAAYKKTVTLLIIAAFLSNGLMLIIPQLIAKSIDHFENGTFIAHTVLLQFAFVAIGVGLFTYIQNILQVYASESVAKDMRTTIVTSLSKQQYTTVQKLTPSRLLTTITSDTDAVKVFISQAVPSLVSSIVLIIGTSILLLTINWRLGLVVLAVIPIIGITFATVLGRIRPLFTVTQEIIDRLNKVINESIIGAALIRVLNAGKTEQGKFDTVNAGARDNGLKILSYFAVLIPVITFVASLATLTIVLLGGHYVILSKMTLGEFTAFNTYIVILIFPILIIGFVSNIIARSAASFVRINEVIDTPLIEQTGTITKKLSGAIEVKKVSVRYGEQDILKDISFTVEPGQKVAIIGPTAAGKTQLLYLLTSLTMPTTGQILYNDTPIDAFDQKIFHDQIGFVFQDSILFNTTLRENIAFNKDTSLSALSKAIQTAELDEFIDSLPNGFDTVVSERGTSLSGGQKQRVMLARALAIDPTILLLDDFTARVDPATEKSILKNIQKNYPNLTLVSVTQKITPIEEYDKIILLMEGELLAIGSHAQLLASSPEYVQIYNSQRSTNQYELHS